MPASVTVPRLGWSMEEGTFVEWLAHDGDHIAIGQALFVLESDKSSETIEALDAGVLRLLPDSPKVGDTVKVGQVLAVIAGENEEVVVARDAPPREERPSPLIAPRSAPIARREGRRAISPRARRIAGQLGVNWS